MLVGCRAEAERFSSLKKINMANNMKGAKYFRQEMVKAVVRELALEMHVGFKPRQCLGRGRTGKRVSAARGECDM